MQKIEIAIGSDHVGYKLKEYILQSFDESKYSITDYGCFNEDISDYPDFASLVCKAIQNKKATKGILICGSGAGMGVAANKYKDIRATVAHDLYTAKQCVEHDDVNVLCLGSKVVTEKQALSLVNEFLLAEFQSEERYLRRRDKIISLEKSD